MREPVESSDRGPMDYFCFAASFFGIILAAAGIVMTSPGLTILGLLELAFGLGFFLIRN